MFEYISITRATPRVPIGKVLALHASYEQSAEGSGSMKALFRTSIPLFWAAWSAFGAIGQDAKVSTDQATASTTVVSPTFSTNSGGELLLAFISTDYLSGSNTTVQSVSGAGLTWFLAVRTNAQRGTSEIWRAFAPTPLSGVSATATLSQRVASSMTVMSFTGVDSSGANGSGAVGAVASGSAASGAPTATLITTRNNSWVFGVGNDFDKAKARTPAIGQALVHQNLSANGDTYWVQMQTSPTPLSGTSVGIKDTAPTSDRFNLSICEILASSSTGTQSWSVSGSISPAASGSGSSVMLSGPSSSVVTADVSGNFLFAGLANGTYTVTPSKTGYTFSPASQNVTVNGANVTVGGFTATAATTSSGLAMDAKVFVDQSTGSTTVVSPTFSTNSGGELLLAFIATDYLSGSNTTVQGVSGAGLTWVLVVRTNTQQGTSEIWRTFAPSPLSGVSATATLSQRVASSMTVMSFTGADSSGANGSGAIGAIASGSAASGAPTATLTTTQNNSWVFGVGNDFDNAIARTPASGQTVVHQNLSTAGDTYWVQMQTSPTPLSGTSVGVKDTAPTSDRFNLSICEILPSAGGIVATPPTVTMTSPAPGVIAGLSTVSAVVSDNVPISGVQFLLDGVPLSAQVTTAPYSINWDTTTVPGGVHSLTAIAQNSSGQTTTSSAVPVTVDNSGNPATVGSWSSPVALPTVAVNLILLPNNKVLFYQDGITASVWDYVNNTFVSVPLSVNLFCSGAAVLADGQVLIAGGYGGSGSSIGIANAELFNPSTQAWTTIPSMAYKRWYPTATTLSDGRVLVMAGWQTTAHTNAGVSEIYNPATKQWTQLVNANNPFETYPFMYQLSDGRIVHIGGSEYATDTDVLDLNTQAWSVIDSRIVDGASATMFAPDRFMKAGAAADSQDVGPASNTTFVLDMTQANSTWQQTPSMAYPRSFMNLTMLPDGSVLATGGETDKNGGNIANAVYAAELWSPQTQTWSTMASMHTPREYHGTALLLPDGRVLESGMGADFGNVPDEKNAEFYSPPYLFKGARPTITQVPSQLQYGASFTVATPDATSIAKVVLIRTGAVTHFFDQNERYVPLSFQQTSGGITVTAPATAYAAPPGYYMLFIVNTAGIPSIAPFVQLPAN